jgi:hypothetical protein
MTAPSLHLSVSSNVSEEIRRLEAEIADLQLKLNALGKGPFGTTIHSLWAKALQEKQAQLTSLTDPSANPKITPSPATSTQLPVFGSPKIDVGRVTVSDLKLNSGSM